MTKEIENIIRNKKFFELTAEEKDLIQEIAETEVDFEQLKFVFTQVEGIKSAEKSHVDKAVKANLDVLFDKTYSQKRLVWYNKLWLFLWPDEARFYARPLLQFATVLALIISVVTFVPFNEKSQLAMKESTTESVENKVVKQELMERSVIDTKEEAVQQPIEKSSDAKALESALNQKGGGWELEGLKSEVSEDVKVSDQLASPSALLFEVDKLEYTYSSNNQVAQEAEYTIGANDDVSLTRSVTTAQTKALSPKDKPEVFDILTALY
jgi:hypothetical protein